MIKDRLSLSKLSADMWNESHEIPIDNFICNGQRMLVGYIDDINGLILAHSIPCVHCPELMFFIKKESRNEAITPQNFLKQVQYGTVTAGHIESLLRIMTSIYAPIFFDNNTWPDSIKNDFSGQLHKFLASLTDTRWKMEGKTVLYIPHEGLQVDPEAASKDKELIQRLESESIP